MTDNKSSEGKFDKVIEKLKDRVNPSEDQLEQLKGMAEKLEGKSEDDIFFEIIKLNQSMMQNMDEKEYNKKLKKLEKIRPMLNEQQSKKLDKLLEALKESSKE